MKFKRGVKTISSLPPQPREVHVAASASSRPASRPAPTIAKHEAAFAKFEKKLEGAGDETLRLSDLPLPPKHGSVSGASRADPVDDRKKAVKKALQTYSFKLQMKEKLLGRVVE